MVYEASIMTDRLIIALAQLNPIVGGVAANLAKAKAEIAKLKDVDLVLFPELFMAGYPPEDLVLRPSFVKACKLAVEELAQEFAAGPAILMGLPWREGDKLHNSVALLKSACSNPALPPARFRLKVCALAFPSAKIFGLKRPVKH